MNDSGSFKACADASVSLNRAGRVLALVDGTADSGQAGQVRVSTCALFADGSSISAEQPIAAPLSPAEHFSFAAVSPVLGQGTHSIQLRCRNNDPGAAPRIFGSSVTTVVLGPG